MTLSDVQIKANKREIIDLLKSTDRDGIMPVIEYLCTSGFFIIPSSLTRHHNWKGGLAQHSLNVCRIALSHNDDLPKDSVILCGLLHDICKARQLFYDESGVLKRRDTYIKGHGYRSVRLLEKLGLRLTDDERRAIRWHMGGYHANKDELPDLQAAKSSALWKLIRNSDRKDAGCN